MKIKQKVNAAQVRTVRRDETESLGNPFDVFDKIFVINLDKHLDRWVRFIEQAENIGFEHKVERVSGVSHEVGSFGCAMSHKKAISIARERGYSNILIFEDDVRFLYDRDYTWDCLGKAWSNLKDMEWDIFYLGINPAVAKDRVSTLKQDPSIKGKAMRSGDIISPEIPFYGRFGMCMNAAMFNVYDRIPDSIDQFTANTRGDMVIKSTLCKKVMVWPALVSVTDAPSFTGVGLDTNGNYKKKDNHIKIVGSYSKLGFTDNRYKPSYKVENVPALFTIWVSDSTELPELQVMCLKSMLYTGHNVKLYSYDKFSNIPEGVLRVDLNGILPRDKCLKNKEILGRTGTAVPDTYCMMADLMRVIILRDTDDVWIDSDIFVLQNIKPFLKHEMVPGMISNWARGLSICNGLLKLNRNGVILNKLLHIVENYFKGERNYGGHGDLAGAHTMQMEILTGCTAEVSEAYLSHLCIVPISKKHQERLYRKADIPRSVQKDIFGIHLWNSGYLDTKFDKLERPEGTVMEILSRAVTEGNNFSTVLDNLFTENCTVEQHNIYSLGEKFPKIFYDKGLLPRTGKVTVITTAFGSVNFIEEALEGIYSQTWFKDHDFEVLIGVDSCPATLIKLSELFFRYTNLKIFYNKENAGTYITRNTMMKQATGDYFVFLDSDDIAKPDLVETIINSGGELTRFRIEFFTTDKTILTMFPSPAYGAFGITRLAMAKLGGFAPWPCSGDAELLTRAKGNVAINVIGRSLYLYRKHPQSLTKNNKTGMRTNLRKQYNARIKSNPVHIKYVPVITDTLYVNTEYRKVAVLLKNKCSEIEIQKFIERFNNS